MTLSLTWSQEVGVAALSPSERDVAAMREIVYAATSDNTPRGVPGLRALQRLLPCDELCVAGADWKVLGHYLNDSVYGPEDQEIARFMSQEPIAFDGGGRSPAPNTSASLAGLQPDHQIKSRAASPQQRLPKEAPGSRRDRSRGLLPHPCERPKSHRRASSGRRVIVGRYAAPSRHADLGEGSLRPDDSWHLRLVPPTGAEALGAGLEAARFCASG